LITDKPEQAAMRDRTFVMRLTIYPTARREATQICPQKRFPLIERERQAADVRVRDGLSAKFA